MIYNTCNIHGYVDGYLGSGRTIFETEYYGKDYPDNKEYKLNDEVEIDNHKGIVIGYKYSEGMLDKGFIVYIPELDETRIIIDDVIFKL